MPKRRKAGALTADVGDAGLGSLFNESGDVKHYGVARKKRVWKNRGNRKRLKRVLGLAARLRKLKGLSNREALKKAWAKTKRKGYRNIKRTALTDRGNIGHAKSQRRKRYHGKSGRKGPGF